MYTFKAMNVILFVGWMVVVDALDDFHVSCFVHKIIIHVKCIVRINLKQSIETGKSINYVQMKMSTDV